MASWCGPGNDLVPQVRSPKCLGAVHEDLTHFDHNCEFGSAIIDTHAPQKFRVIHQSGAPIHAQCVFKPRNDEQESNARIGENVDQCIETVVAGSVRYRQRALIKNFDKADRITAGADIRFSSQILCADAQEWRTPDKLLRMLAEVILTLLYGQSMCRIKQTSKRLFICYGEFWINLELLHHIAFRSSPVGLISPPSGPI